MLSLILPATLLFVFTAQAQNDWSVPCHSGSCSYSIVNGTASGSVLIAGNTNAISDLSPAGGWTVWGCNATGMAQEIRAICTGSNATCSHIYQGGAADTVVRMPPNCGTLPFARIAQEWKHDNQTIPVNIQTQIGKRDDPPVVRGIRLDANFSAVNPSKNGNVALFIQGTTIPGALNGTVTTSEPQRRGLFGKIGQKIKGAADDVKNAVKDAVDDTKSAVKDSLELSSFNKTKEGSKTIDIDQPFTLFDESVECAGTNGAPSLSEDVKISVDAKVHADVDYGFVAAGSLIPPNITELGLFANFDAILNGTLTVDAKALATISTPKLPLFNIGLPALDFPGIFTLGPSFQVNALALATISAELEMTVDLAYNITNGKMFFPSSAGNSQGNFGPTDTGLSISASPLITEGISLEAHVIPAIVFGISALDNLANVDVELDFDTSAKLGLTLQESVSTEAATNGTSTGFQGCVDMTTGFDVKAAANAGFFSVFDKSAQVSLFSKQFPLFQKCTGSGASRKRVFERRHSRDLLVKRGLTCPASAFTPASIVEQTILANAITAL